MADLAQDDTLAEVLLPDNGTAYHVAHLQAMVEAWPLDVAAIAREGDPMTCRADKLPFLFCDKGGTWWNDAWPEARKRAYVRDLLVYKRLEGTPLGIELYANLEGALVLREELPPGKVFAVKNSGLNRAQELALMPQLRLYHHAPPAYQNRAVAFAAGGRFFAGHSFAARDRARVLGRYPMLYEPRTGAETPLDVVDLDRTAGTVSLRGPSTRGHAIFVGHSYAGHCTAARSNRPDPITLDLADPAMETVAVSPPCRRQQMAAASGKVAGRVFAMAPSFDVGTYDRLTLYDASRIAPGAGRAGRAFFAGQRLGVRRYTMWLHLYVPGPTPVVRGRKRFAGHFIARRRDLTTLHNAMHAIECARRPGDAIYVVLEGYRAGARPAPLPAIGDLT